MRTALLAGLLLAVVTASCGGASHSVLRLWVTPAVSVEDQPVRIRFEGLRRLQGVWLELRSTDAKGRVFVSKAAFGADENGVLDLVRARPLVGSAYSGRAWQMGLVTSMTAPNGPPLSKYAWGSAPRRFVLTAVSASRTIASTTFMRGWRQGMYTTVRETVDHDGFVGTFYAPAEAGKHEAVLAIGGEEGGIGSSWLGERLAAHGIPTLVVGYFHARGLPDRLEDIPLEYFRTALAWLDQRPEVDVQRVSLLGVSYGSEAALLVGARYPNLVHGVAALVPSSVVTCGTIGAGRGGLRSHACIGSPWTIAGKPLRYAAVPNKSQPADDRQALIPVERIPSPVFLACGGHDQIWNSCRSAREIVARRNAHGGELTDLYVYPDAGHYVGTPSLVFQPGSLASDFSVPADERGREDLWPRLLAFLHAT